MGNIDLSVLLAVYNAEKYLDRCLQSVMAQSVEHMEIIVVNDGSTDGSEKILKKYENCFQSVRMIHKEKNEGTLLTRLDGMLLARGRYVVFIDGDDTFEPYSLHRILEYAAETGTDILEFGYQLIDTEDRKIYNRAMGNEKAPVDTRIEGERQCLELLDLYHLEVPLFKRLYSRRLYKKVIHYFTRYRDYRRRFEGILHEDEYITPLFFSNAKGYYCIKDKIYNYRYLRKGSITGNISANPERRLRAGEEYMYICKNLAYEFRRKGLISGAEYFEYHARGIEFFCAKCRECKTAYTDRIGIIHKYYTLRDVLHIYVEKRVYERKNWNHWNR